MNFPRCTTLILCLTMGLLESGCKQPESDQKSEAPPALKVQSVQDRNVFEVDRPERFQLTASVPHTAVAELRVTGTGVALMLDNPP